MPRDIPVGNGHMLVCFDHHYQIRDLYYPHVGQENHCGSGPCRFGVYADLPPTGPKDDPVYADERRRRRLYWTSQGWEIDRKYEDMTLASQVRMTHDLLKMRLDCTDTVDFHRSVLVRRIDVTNLSDRAREARLVHHNNFEMYGTKVGDTAYYDPRLRALVHYRKVRYLMTSWFVDGEQRIDEFATGTAGFFNAEGTWRDAEDGALGNNAIAQGAVDSTMLVSVPLQPHGTTTVYMILGAGRSFEDLEQLHHFLHREGPQGVIDRTRAYWRLWVDANINEFPEAEDAAIVKGADDDAEEGADAPPLLSHKVRDLYHRSLLVVRTQIDNKGAIIAANDSDYLQYSRDTYSYLWPRDGALVAAALDDAGFPDVARSFYSLCAEIIKPEGYFLHKYNPDGSPASSWHPWVSLGRPQLPIQEDETALVIWALWRHYMLYRDIEFVRPMWIRLIQPAADFMCRFRDPRTGLPLPSYDLWEERWGVHAFTVASVYGGLSAAWKFATCFGDIQRAKRYGDAAASMREGFCKYMWSEEHNRFLRRIVPLDHERTALLMAEVMNGHEPQLQDAVTEMSPEGAALDFELDHIIDSSMFSIFAFGLLPTEDKRVEQTMQAIEDRLWVKTEIGGLARYEDDHYHKIADDVQKVPGNPWFICTLWVAQYRIERAKTLADLESAKQTLEWVTDHALPSGVLAEQVHPYTGDPISVSPLTWSHATVVSVVIMYLRKFEALSGQSPRGGRPNKPDRVRRSARIKALSPEPGA